VSTENYSIGKIIERLQGLVDDLAGKNVSKFAEMAGINVQTLHTYLKGRAPSTEALFNICINLKVSTDWLLTGNGPIYINGDVVEQQPEADPEIADLIEGARRVLKSGNAVAFDALERNIRYFDFAIQQEKDMAEQKKTLAEQKTALEKMEKRLAALEEKKNCNTPSNEEPLSRKKAV
jgi:transcriptional regulator with XRE-family HTH domain